MSSGLQAPPGSESASAADRVGSVRRPPLEACLPCRGCIVGICATLAKCPSAVPLPAVPNMDAARAVADHYLALGAYEADIAAVAAEAHAWLEERLARPGAGGRPALVLDIDETSISNQTVIRRLDYGFVPEPWIEWMASCAAPAIAPIQALYLRARERGCAVFFITGRKEATDRVFTEELLRRAGYGDYEGLFMVKPGEEALPNAQRKLEARRSIESQGYLIVANVGDQDSDLSGGCAERVFKLPNPFYLME
jgi:predicted secreted acid phosphatase